MSSRTSDINKITSVIISISLRLIAYALIILLLYEAVVRGFAFGHQVFYAEAAEPAPGRDIAVVIDEGESVSEAAGMLAARGLIKSEFAFVFQSVFYDYDTIYPGNYDLNTSMTSKEILQLLNEKPEEAQAAQTGGAGAAAAKTRGSSGTEAGTAAETAEAEAAEDTAGAEHASEDTAGAEGAAEDAAGAAAAGEGAAEEDGAAPGAQAESGAEGDETAAAWEETYEGEDQVEEGGWIEDVAEDTQ